MSAMGAYNVGDPAVLCSHWVLNLGRLGESR